MPKRRVIAKNHEIFKLATDEKGDDVIAMWCDVYGHANLAEGTRVRTSIIVRQEGNEVETLNTLYILED